MPATPKESLLPLSSSRSSSSSSSSFVASVVRLRKSKNNQ